MANNPDERLKVSRLGVGIEVGRLAKQMAQIALTALQQSQLGYAVLIAAKPNKID